MVQDDGGGGGETQGEVDDTAGDLHEVHDRFFLWLKWRESDYVRFSIRCQVLFTCYMIVPSVDL